MRDNEKVTRGDLPHWYKPGHAHFVTYRLYDSIPRNFLVQWKQERQFRRDHPFRDITSAAKRRERAHKLYFRSYDQYLDLCSDRPWLLNLEIAKIIRENLYHHHASLYQLLAWCVMPNHVHLLIQPFEFDRRAASRNAGSVFHVGSDGKTNEPVPIHSEEVQDRSSPLSRIMHSLKSYTAKPRKRSSESGRPVLATGIL